MTIYEERMPVEYNTLIQDQRFNGSPVKLAKALIKGTLLPEEEKIAATWMTDREFFLNVAKNALIIEACEKAASRPASS